MAARSPDTSIFRSRIGLGISRGRRIGGGRRRSCLLNQRRDERLPFRVIVVVQQQVDQGIHLLDTRPVEQIL